MKENVAKMHWTTSFSKIRVIKYWNQLAILLVVIGVCICEKKNTILFYEEQEAQTNTKVCS